jgi:hypothetical protein
MDKQIGRIKEVGELEEITVEFDGEEKERSKLNMILEVEEYDDFLEETLTVDQYFTVWGKTAVEASNKLKEGQYLYIGEYTEKVLPITEEYTTPLIARNIKKMKVVAAEKAKALQAKLLSLADGQKTATARKF